MVKQPAWAARGVLQVSARGAIFETSTEMNIALLEYATVRGDGAFAGFQIA